MAAYRSLLHPLSIQPFSLEAPVLLPAQPQVQRTNSSVAWGGVAGGDNFALPSSTPLLTHATGHQRTLSISPAPGFFEPRATNSNNAIQSTVSAFLNPPAPLARQQVVQQTQSAFFSPAQQQQPQQQQQVQYQQQQPLSVQQAKISFVPSLGTHQYFFEPWFELGSHSNERGAAQEIFAFQNLHVRPEYVDRSPEELRQEDYAHAGLASLCNNPVQPGPVDMGLAKPVPSSNVFQVPQPFGTQSVGLFNTSPQPPLQQGRSAFFAAPVLPLQTQQTAFYQPPQPNYFAPQQQQIPVWGTATAGFGNGWQQQPQQPQAVSAFAPPPIWGAQQQQPVFGFQPQQQPFAVQNSFAPAPAFGAFNTGGFNPGFGLQPLQQQPSAFGFGFQSFQPQAYQYQYQAPVNLANLSSFNFGSSQSWLSQKVYQVPQHAQMFWNLPATESWAQWLKTLPYLRGHTLSMACFGGVQVSTPSVEAVLRKREEERMKIAQPDDDPFGLHMIQKVEPTPPPLPPMIAAGSPLEATEPNARSSSVVDATTNGGNGGGIHSSPLKRGSSSPPLLVSPTRSPALLSKNHGLRSSESSLLQVPGLGLGSMSAPGSNGSGNGGQHSRSGSNCSALLSHSPRLVPLPESPYLESTSLGSSAIAGPAGSHSPPVRSQTISHAPAAAPSTPERHRSAHFSTSNLHGSVTPQSNPRSILFGSASSQADAPPAHGSPHRSLSSAASSASSSSAVASNSALGILRTPDQGARKLDGAQRELEWAARLVA